MRTLFVALALLWQVGDVGRTFSHYLDAAAYLEGAESAENFSEEAARRYYELHIHPLKINYASAASLMSTGFFTAFQAASIRDYICRNGDVLSFPELAAVPGIGEEMSKALSFFLSFESSRLPSQRLTAERTEIDASMCNSIKNEAVSSRMRLAVQAPRGWSGGLCATDALQGAYLKRSGASTDLTVGSFNARFGQGLTFSSGFSMSGVQTPAGLSRNPSGIAPSATSNASYALRGVAAAFRFGKVTLQSLSTFDLATQALNLSVLGSRSTGSATFSRSCDTYSLGADFKSTLGYFTLWGEASASIKDRTLGSAALAGAYYNMAYRRRLALMLRSYSIGYANPYAGAVRSTSKCCDQMGLDFGVEYDDFMVLLDLYRRPSTGEDQFKLISTYSHSWEAATAECRLNSRFIGSSRHEVRLTGSLLAGVWDFSCRVQVLKGAEWAGLAYVQAVIKDDAPRSKAATLRLTYFNASSWNDRLYGYTPDVPGFFSVKAYYGCGIELAIYMKLKELALKIGRTVRFDGRAPSFEVRLQVSLRSSVSIPRPGRSMNL